ncbi:MAG: glycosyltransferase, partial [Proteobacteria bacterium]|nr:glycosyltransferase [Pseudomonadota bacterium]
MPGLRAFIRQFAPRLVLPLALVFGALVQGAGWLLSYDISAPPNMDTKVRSVSYDLGGPELDGKVPNDKDMQHINRQLDSIASVAHSLRLYASNPYTAFIAALADDRDVHVTIGAWISTSDESNRREIDAALKIANQYGNVSALVIGNETLLRDEQTVDELGRLLRDARRRSRVPVTTGETWDTWLKYPELANNVDFISAHILPYWEGIPAENAIAHAFHCYELLRERFPGKKIVIAEFGWPSRGYNYKGSVPDDMSQAEVVRDFIAEAEKQDVDYNLMEAFDQPWKTAEGSVGAYWGLFDASGHAKFSLSGDVQEAGHKLHAALGLLIGVLLTLFTLRGRNVSLRHTLVVSLAAQSLAAGGAFVLAYPLENYLNTGSAIAWGIGFLLMVPLTVMTLIKIDEVAEVTVGHRPTRLLQPPLAAPQGFNWPKVSIQVPAYRENPDMLNATLSSLARLDYPNFEVTVIINNTPDEAQWKTVEAHCATLGSRFKFLNMERVDGFKAGALNRAMPFVAKDAEILALIDADYVVEPDWLRNLIPAFADPAIAMVQAPQDHRDGAQSAFKSALNSEYAGFFDIGMVQRNERNALITHGTMLMLRRSAFDAAGGWQTDTITEDTELGLRLLQGGHQASYTNRRYGHGLLPDTFSAFKTQRYRWAYGAMQIIRKHWRHMLPSSPSLSWAQKHQFITGWSYWVSDAFGVLAALFNLVWVPMILFVGVLIPTLPFTVPILVMFVVSLLHCGLLYSTRVRLSPGQILGAAVAAMSLQFTVARAVAKGLVSDNMPFKR